MKGLRNPVIKYKGKDYYIGCNEVLSKCKSKYPSEVFLLKPFEY